MANAIPADRVPYGGWVRGTNVGVIGGITLRTTVYDDDGFGVTAACNALDNTGATDVYAALQAIIDACPSNQAVVMPGGDFRTDSTLILPSAFSNKTLRGQGSGVTVIRSRANVGMVAGSASSYSSTLTSVTAGGLAVGVNSATLVGDLSEYVVGGMIRFMFQNKITPLMYSIYGFNVNTNTSPSGQIVRITAIAGQDITFFPPIAFDRTGEAIQVARLSFNATGISVENLTVDMDDFVGAGAYSALGLYQVYNGWMIDVEGINPLNYGILMESCLCCELKDSWGGELKGGGSNGSGLLFNGTCNSVVENCDFIDAFPNIECNFGISQNVFGCNFGDGQCNTNHSPHNDGNLHIYNAWRYTISDGYFGSESRLTFYKNLFWESHANLRRFNRETTIVGCIQQTETSCGLPFIGTTSSFGTAQLSLGDPWRDYGMAGVLTTRTDDTHGEVTITTGGWLTLVPPETLHRVYFYWGTNLENVAYGDVTDWSDPVVTITLLVGTWPAVSTVMGAIGPGSYGGGGEVESATFPELDLDVEATLVAKGNYQASDNSTSSLDGDTLIDPFYSGKPAFMAPGDAWPPFDYLNPSIALYTNLPAGRRYSEFVPPEAPNITTPCTVTGDPVEGQTLTAVPGIVTGNPPPTRTWRWERDGTPIGGATSINYTLTGADVGHMVGPVQIETNTESPFTDESEATPLLILAFTGDVLVVDQVANAAPVTELWLRSPLVDGVATGFAYYTVQHSGPYPTQPVNNFAYKRFGTPNDQIYVFQGTVSEAEAIASVP